MDFLYLVFIILNSVLLVIALTVNGAIMYFMIKYKRLRAMTVAYLVMLTTMADIVMNIATVGFITEAYRNYMQIIITFEACWCEQIWKFLTIPISKLSLFVLSIDRVYAVFWPIVYRKRNHARFAGLMLFFCLIPTAITTTLGVFDGVRLPQMMKHLCVAQEILPAYAISMGMIFTVLPDVGTYVANALLIYKIRQPPVTSSHNKDTERQRAITRALLLAVAVHTVLSVVPVIAAITVNITAKFMTLQFAQGVMYETIRGHSIRVLGQIESIINAYVYATKLPDFRAVIKGEGKISITATERRSIRSKKF